MIGAEGEIIHWSKGKGEIRVMGEIWQAVSDKNFKAGDCVKVDAIKGLKLTISENSKKG